MTRTRVLVTGTGHLGVGEGIIQCLQMVAGDHYEVVAANSDIASASLFTSKRSVLLPQATSPHYIQSVLEACAQHGIRFLIPGSEPELRALAPLAGTFEEMGCVLLANSPEVIAVGDDKLLTHQFLTRHGVPTPLTSHDPSAAADGSLGWPVVVKPVVGGGSKNVFVAHTARELQILVELMQLRKIPVFAQEYVGTPEDEYTASSLMTPDGRSLGSFAARRTLAGGATATVEVRDYPELRELAETISALLGATGPVNIQARMHMGRASVFEINPRFSGSAPFRALCGFNEPHLLMQYYLRGLVEPRGYQRDFFGVRAFDHQIFPLNSIPEEWRQRR